MVDGITYGIQAGNTLAIPAFAPHQYVNGRTGSLEILVDHTRTMLENLGPSVVPTVSESAEALAGRGWADDLDVEERTASRA